MRLNVFSLVVAGLTLIGSHNALASTIACTDFTGSNGTTTFPGTFVGTVGSGAGNVCQIGNISQNNVSSTGTFVNNSQTVSIYSFYWTGGALTISEQLGNNGTGKGVDVYLDSLASSSSTSPTATLATTEIPFQSGPTTSYTLINGMTLASGYYAIETALVNPTMDPTFQVNFTSTAPAPEPESLLLVGTGLVTTYAGARRRWRR